MHHLFTGAAVSQEPHSGRQAKEADAVCAGLRHAAVRAALSVGPAGCPVVVRGYERDVLPAIRRPLRKLHPLPDDPVQHGVSGAV